MEIVTFGFDVRYIVEALEGHPSGEALRFRRSRHPAGEGELVFETGSEVIWLEVTPGCSVPWVGCFECGPGRLTGLFATPSPEVLCVVAKGQGFWVPVCNPENYEIIQSIPIQLVFSVPGKAMIVFVDYIGLEAYGANGFVWRTGRLSWDGLKITEVTTERINGYAWDSPGNQEVPFSVDTETGASQGGSSPAAYSEE